MAGVSIEGLEELLAGIYERLTAIEAKLDEPTVVWMSTEQAAIYVGTTPKALRQAEYRGKVKGHRAGNGRVLFHKADLDRFATANDAAHA